MPAAAGAGGQAGRGRWGPLPILLLPTGEAILNAGNFGNDAFALSPIHFARQTRASGPPSHLFAMRVGLKGNMAAGTI